MSDVSLLHDISHSIEITAISLDDFIFTLACISFNSSTTIGHYFHKFLSGCYWAGNECENSLC